MYFFYIIQYIILVFFIFKIVTIFKSSRSISMLFGTLILLLLYVIGTQTKTFSYLVNIIRQIEQYVIFILVIVFIDDIRKFLAEIGRYPLMLLSGKKNNILKKMNECDILANVVFALSKEKLGSLIIIEKNIPLDSFKEKGSVLNADMNFQLMYSLFTHSSTLHDGAMIINLDQKKILAAGCVLPLSQTLNMDKKLGTRHRAALGLSEISDAYIILTSEESGEVKIVHKGNMLTIANKENLKQFFEVKKESWFKKRFKFFSKADKA